MLVIIFNIKRHDKQLEVISCDSKTLNGIEYVRNALNEIMEIPLGYLKKIGILHCTNANSMNVLFLRDAERYVILYLFHIY